MQRDSYVLKGSTLSQHVWKLDFSVTNLIIVTFKHPCAFIGCNVL